MATSPSKKDSVDLYALESKRMLSLATGRFERSALTIELSPDPRHAAQDGTLAKFVRSAGGSWGRIVLIPLAGGDSQAYGRSFAQSLSVHGAGMISVLHLTERRHADDAHATDLIDTATGILLAASAPAQLTALLEDSAVLRRIRQRNREGIVLGITGAATSLFAIALGPPVELLGGEPSLGAW